MNIHPTYTIELAGRVYRLTVEELRKLQAKTKPAKIAYIIN